MKKVFKTVLILLLALILLFAAVSVWQWDNVKVIFTAINHTQEEIDALVKESESKTDRILSKLSESELNNLSDEDKAKLISGEITEDEALAIIRGSNDNSKVDDIISRMYVLRSEYLGALSSLEAEARGAGKSIPKKQRTISKKLELMETYTGRAAALESQCNAKMESLISELEAELKRTGGDMSLISEVRSAYEAEKAAKKSQLLGKYGKYLK